MVDQELPTVSVFGAPMAYRQMGDKSKPTALFLHGNPTSSYIWRNIIPAASEVAYCVAPDLIGFGQSAKPKIYYSFADHATYLSRFLAQLNIEHAYLIAQDWGTALAFDLAARQPTFVRGLAFMEFIRPFDSWNQFHHALPAREIFKKFRTPGVGEQLVLHENAFVEKILPGSVLRKLSPEEIEVYRAPFPDRMSRIPTLRFPRELPIEGDPPDVHARMMRAHACLKESTYPKLLFVGKPGALVTPEYARTFAGTLKNCDLMEVGAGLHYLQEDQPQAIAEGVVGLIKRTEADRARAISN